MSRLPLSLAVWRYDRVMPLITGQIVPEGIDLNCQILEVEETFFRMARHAEFDVAEMSLSSYCLCRARGDDRFIALPVFLSRFFRHSCIYVSAQSGIVLPQDLVGKRVGVPEYQMTAPVWIRGLLQDDFGVDPSSVTYLTGGEEQAGRTEKLPLDLPSRFELVPIGPDQTLSSMLASGEIDALYTARTPSTFRSHPDQVKRLFNDPMAVETDYFQRTGIFPIMHVVVVRRALYEQNRWIARSLFKAFESALAQALVAARTTSANTSVLPWQALHAEHTASLMGDPWWTYGVAQNRAALETFSRYHHEQGLSRDRLPVDALFCAEADQGYVI